MAASYRIPAVEKFDFAKPEEWSRWIRRFERFRQASDLASKSEEQQVSTLVYSLGDKAEDLLTSFNLSEDDLKKYETVKGKFESYFAKRRNPIFERARFNRRTQGDKETADEFIADLYHLAENCGYGNLHDELVRDRIVVGIKDAELSEKLQLEADLTLEKCITKVRQSESVKAHQEIIRGQSDKADIEAIGRRSKVPPRKTTTVPPKPHSCSRCGRSPPHSRQQCPANQAVCHKCHKKGHFKQCCKSKWKVREVQQGESDPPSDSGEEFLGTVNADSVSINKPWTTDVQLNGRRVEFKVDTGADVTVIPEREYDSKKDGKLEPASIPLNGPTGENLEVRGRFTAQLTRKGIKSQQEIHVVRNLSKALLGRPAIQALNVAVLIEPVQGEEIVGQFPELFKGLGKLKDRYKIKLREGAKPFALTTPRRVPIPLLPKVKEELKRMESMGVITKVDDPTEWCAGMVVVPKRGGKVRICVDLTQLNQSVCRERHILPSVEQILAQIGGAKHFTKLDANSGYWQIELEPESAKLTTFITPFGRFCFNRLPFGITSAPEHFQKRMTEILGDIPGVVCLVDDILVTGRTQEEHDRRLKLVLTRLSKAGLTLGREKCDFNKTSVNFVGQLVDELGVRPDPEKVRAIQQMKTPTNVSELRRFLGVVNQQSKFAPHLADQTKPLRELLSKRNHWSWGHDQQQAFDRLKKALSSSEVLAFYDPKNETTVSADASSYGLGAVLRQSQPDGSVRPIAYVSRALTETEQRYAQIEKEALAATWACERFQNYLLGTKFKVETDHKPLVPLLSVKPLDSVPVRVQRFRLRLMRFDFTISHVPGKELNTADALSRAPVTKSRESNLTAVTREYVQAIVNNLPASDERLKTIREQQDQDLVCKQLKRYCSDGKAEWKGLLKPYHQVRAELTVAEGLLLRGCRIVIPTSLRAEILDKIHSGHQGMTKCRQRARDSVWWPGIKQEIDDKVSKCSICCKMQVQHREPLIPSPFPQRPWQRVGTDLFEWKKSDYLLVVDYYSRFIEIAKLTTTTASSVISHLKSIFARHGLPETVVSDNGPQYSSSAFKEFSKKYEFKHVTSSPKYPQANGEAERAVKTTKQLLEKNTDPYLALLSYRSTPLENGYSPAELLMGRKVRTTLPITAKQLKPALPKERVIREKERMLKKRNKSNFDSRHKVKDLQPLQPGDTVWIPENKSSGIVVEQSNTRSYNVRVNDGVIRRNRHDLIILPDNDSRGTENSNEQRKQENSKDVESSDNASRSSETTKTRSGRVSKPPERLTQNWT